MVSVTEIIRTHRDEILELWTQEARKAASARGLDKVEFANILPEFLTELGNAGAELGQFSGRRRKRLESHLATRIHQGFNIAEVVEELAILGRCIARMWAGAPAQQQPDAADVERLFSELHTASAVLTETFSSHMLEDEQTEKRYLRLIQKVANETLQGDGVYLDERLDEILVLVMEAMNAQSAALLLYDAEGQNLVVAAAAGAGAEQLEHYATSLDPGSFAGQVASKAEAISIAEAEISEIQVEETLLSSGIRSLLGVRLPPHRRLLGILYVGLSEARAFTARETGRIESLGEWLTLHLDNARLYADLRRKLEDLHEEQQLREHFVSVLAHDLRGPLSVAKMHAYLLAQQPELLEERRDLALKVDRNLERADQMIRNLLDANRIVAGERLSLRLEASDLGNVARDVVDELSTVHGERFVLEADENVRGIWSSEELRRALWNLAVNAVKYGAPDRPVTLTVRRTEEGALASVHNHGPAISAEDQARLFRPFSRTRGAQAGSTGGWGLGLSLVRGCAEAHGGRVDLESDEEHGTTFTLYLPRDARPYQTRVEPVEPAGPT